MSVITSKLSINSGGKWGKKGGGENLVRGDLYRWAGSAQEIGEYIYVSIILKRFLASYTHELKIKSR